MRIGGTGQGRGREQAGSDGSDVPGGDRTARARGARARAVRTGARAVRRPARASWTLTLGAPDTEDLLALAADLGVGPIEDLGLLDSAAHRPGASVFGRDDDPDIDAKAGARLESHRHRRSTTDHRVAARHLATSRTYSAAWEGRRS